MPVIFSFFVFLLLALAPFPVLAADACINLDQKAAELERRALQSDDSNDAALLGYFYQLVASEEARGEKWDKNRDKELGMYPGAGKKDAERAVRWLRRAADKGNAVAQYWLALAYMFSEGVKADLGEYVRLMRLSADQGLSGAQYKLGFHYSAFLAWSKEKIDLPEAIAWHRKAAAQGHRDSIHHLAQLHNGLYGWDKSPVETLYWRKLGQKLGDKRSSAEYISQLEAQVTESERAQIDARAAAWKPEPSPVTIASRKLNAPMEEMEKWIERKCSPAPPPNPKKKKGPA